MAKRTKLIKLNEQEKNLILQKSNPLITLSETGITLQELKILDVYLSRINSHDVSSRLVKFEKGELEKILNVDRIRKEELDKRLDGLFKVVTIKDNRIKKGFTKIALFEKAEAVQDDNGLWQIELSCTVSAMQYIFNIENIGYLRYRLKNVINLTSRYSYVLYLYLEHNRYKKSFVVSLDELKQILNCNVDYYKEFKYFNADILKKCHKELTDKTNLKFDYSLIRQCRKVVAIQFYVADDDEHTTSTRLQATTNNNTLGKAETYSKQRQTTQTTKKDTSYNIDVFNKYDIFE